MRKARPSDDDGSVSPRGCKCHRGQDDGSPRRRTRHCGRAKDSDTDVPRQKHCRDSSLQSEHSEIDDQDEDTFSTGWFTVSFTLKEGLRKYPALLFGRAITHGQKYPSLLCSIALHQLLYNRGGQVSLSGPWPTGLRFNHILAVPVIHTELSPGH